MERGERRVVRATRVGFHEVYGMVAAITVSGVRCHGYALLPLSTKIWCGVSKADYFLRLYDGIGMSYINRMFAPRHTRDWRGP